MVDYGDSFMMAERFQLRREAGKRSLRLGIAALAVAAAGYILGLVIPWSVSLAQSSAGTGRAVFFPMGGVASLALAVFAISVGQRVKRFIDGLSGPQRERLGRFVDLEKEWKRASTGVILGIVSICVNPLIAFSIITILRFA